ncbi:FMN reductase (NADH) RutF [Caldovatus sediminis]|uniref:FMN reductase (NADH) RutF n=1 Tax=Caldovatus sediminis TaxID=2041189 RepID=A0A8J2Z8Y3_9PROT|nr:flavin reductase [Caldovatus sediminis]GGG24851.1 FMN reductase (NADH) RutF [Caldovatus sediminis]
MTVPPERFRDAMARLGAAVNVITTGGPAGRGGLTASAVCSVTDDPPTLLVCMNRKASAHPLFKANGVLCVNTLAASQREVSDTFSGRTGLSGEDRFACARWTELATGAPVLEGAVASFDCRIVDVVERGTHSVVFAEVEAIRQGDPGGEALIYFARNYHRLGGPTPRDGG